MDVTRYHSIHVDDLDEDGVISKEVAEVAALAVSVHGVPAAGQVRER